VMCMWRACLVAQAGALEHTSYEVDGRVTQQGRKACVLQESGLWDSTLVTSSEASVVD
jgi:hypothetical protein